MADRSGRRLVVNPTLKLTAVVELSRRGRGRTRVEVTDPHILGFLLAATAPGGRPPRPRGMLAGRLVEDGVLVWPEEVPRGVRLDPRLGTARGVNGRASATRGTFPLRLPAGCHLRPARSVPPGLARRTELSLPFLPDGDLLWVRQAGSRITLPYSLAPRLAGAVRDLAAGRPVASSVRRDAVSALESVGALESGAVAGAAWRGRVRAWRRELRASGYAVLRGLFSPVFLSAVRKYYRGLEAEGHLPSARERRGGVPLLHDEALLTFLGDQLGPLVRQVTGETTPSTFCFLREYEPGAILQSHRDKPFCRWNIDLVVGGEPVPDRRGAWPLWMDVRGRPRALKLGLGDGVLYKGTDVRHWRSAQRRGRTTVLACLHYGRPRRASR